MISLVKDRKGPCWILGNKRCGITQTIFLTPDEITELREKLNELQKQADCQG